MHKLTKKSIRTAPPPKKFEPNNRIKKVGIINKFDLIGTQIGSWQLEQSWLIIGLIINFLRKLTDFSPQ
jgi:hypothetical protein